jgi:ABC-2 type transport system permease protein
LGNLIIRDIKVKYRRSVLGILWSVLNPLLSMIVISAVFSKIFRFNVEHFNVYYLTGSIMFGFMTEATTASMTSVLGAAPLIKKVYIPKFIFPLQKTTFGLVNLGFSMIAVLIVLIFSGIGFSFTMPLFIFPIICCYLFSLGLSFALSALTVYFRDIQHLYSVIITIWLYLTPIIYPFEAIPEKLQVFIKFNPMYYYVTYFRDALMYKTVPSLEFHVISIVSALLVFVIGALIFKKAQKNFILYM